MSPAIVARRSTARYDRLQKARSVGFGHEGDEMNVALDLHQVYPLPRVSAAVRMLHHIQEASLFDGGNDALEGESSFVDELPVLGRVPVKAAQVVIIARCVGFGNGRGAVRVVQLRSRSLVASQRQQRQLLGDGRGQPCPLGLPRVQLRAAARSSLRTADARRAAAPRRCSASASRRGHTGAARRAVGSCRRCEVLVGLRARVSGAGRVKS